MDADVRHHGRQPVDRLPTPSTLVQVCDRCRWKKIKCDGTRPCSNCRNANFPCESRARLSKQATPRSYVQYLEARVRQLEGKRDNEWSPQGSNSRHSPYGESHLRTSHSPDVGGHPKKSTLPDWTVLKELGTHVIDEDGFSRYMGPSSGVGFSAKVLQEILDDNQPEDHDYYSLFSVDDFKTCRALESADVQLWQVVPTDLPPREITDHVLNLFFIFTERTFPALHKPTFMHVVDQLYRVETISLDWFEHLAQFYFAMSAGFCFDAKVTSEERLSNQIRAMQTGCRCYYGTLHKRRDGLTRLQTLVLYSYSLILLRQRSEALRVSGLANTKASECGLHHDGRSFHGNPLDTEMRRRVFWCVFTLHLFNCCLEGLPRSLHEADITIADPNDIDDDQLTTTEVINSIPGRTRIHRFVSTVRLVRILSRALDVLYTHNKRKHASTRIEQMNRLCCEHLLDQLDFSFEETPDDIPDPESEDPADMAILASYANEQLLYHFIRWLIHRPGLALSQREPHFASCLQVSTEAAAAMLRCANTYKRVLPFIKVNPAAHPFTVFVASLTPLYRTWLLKTQPTAIPMLGYSADDDVKASQNALAYLAHSSADRSDIVRRRVLQTLVSRVFGDDHEELRHLEIIKTNPETSTSPSFVSRSGSTSNQSHEVPISHSGMEYQQHQIEHFTAQEDLRTFVHDAFSPAMGDHWPEPGAFDDYGPYHHG